jgi:hypothetical protein
MPQENMPTVIASSPAFKFFQHPLERRETGIKRLLYVFVDTMYQTGGKLIIRKAMQ